jgi:hypothetical protein
MNLQELIYDTTRQIVTTTRGVKVPIKEHRGWRYINYEGSKIGLNKLPIKPTNCDPVFDYWFGGGFQNYPCTAMDYWIYRHRLLNRITTKQYAEKFNVKKGKYGQ